MLPHLHRYEDRCNIASHDASETNITHSVLVEVKKICSKEQLMNMNMIEMKGFFPTGESLYSGHFLEGHSLERTPLYKGHNTLFDKEILRSYILMQTG